MEHEGALIEVPFEFAGESRLPDPGFSEHGDEVAAPLGEHSVEGELEHRQLIVPAHKGTRWGHHRLMQIDDPPDVHWRTLPSQGERGDGFDSHGPT